MGCSSSKRIEAGTLDVYRPAATSFAVFDIYAIEEPWLKGEHASEQEQQQQQEKATHVPPLVLEKLNALEEGPRSWGEVSRVLEDLKPTLHSPAPAIPDSDKRPQSHHPQPPPPALQNSPTTRKNVSFHTVAELDAKLSPKKPTDQTMRTELKSTESMVRINSKKPAEKTAGERERARARAVKDNMFIVRDREEREREGKAGRLDRMMSRREPLSEYPEKCPPGGGDSLVLYTTSLGGVRRTYEDCNKVRTVLESHRVVFDERDVSLHGEFLKELRELVGEGEGEGEGGSVPRLFIKGRYIGGVKEVVELNELGRLGKLLNSAKVERGVGRQGCEGCGGARFVPCLDCGGSCKLLVGDTKHRCPNCNENGLVHCPVCRL